MKAIKIFLIIFIFNNNCGFSQSNATAIQKRWIAMDVVGSKAKKEKYEKLYARHSTEMEFKNGKFFSYQDGVLQGTAVYTMAGDGKSLVVQENGKTRISLKIISLKNETLNAVMYGFLSEKDTIIYKVSGDAAISQLTNKKAAAGWSEVEKNWNIVSTNYQRKYDLVKNLINTEKGIGNFDEKILTELITAQNNTAGTFKFTVDELTAEKIKKMQVTEKELNNAVTKSFVALKDYPAVASTLLKIQPQFEGLENNIMVARADYNTAVANYNNAVKGNRSKSKDINFKPEEAPTVVF